MAGTILDSTFRLLLLLTVVVLVAVGSKNEEPSLEVVPGFATTSRTTDNSDMVTGTRKLEAGKASTPTSETEAGYEDRLLTEVGEVGDEEVEDDDGDDDDDGDEYEEELRGVAESHEAMSRNEGRNEISNSPAGIEAPVTVNRSVGNHPEITQKFDSLGKNTESGSDESYVSNEAVPNEEDEEVAELLKYKQKGTTTLMKKDVAVGGIENPRLKVKRVPTVKKELSTQKEIIATNETRFYPKTVVSNVEIVNGLDDDTKQDRGYAATIAARDSHRYELVRGDMGLEEEYTDVDTQGDVLRQLDKRRHIELNGPDSHILGEYAHEAEEQHRKLQELGIDENILAESLMELLTRLAKDPRHRERMHRLLHVVEEDLEIARTSLPDSKKRGYSQDPLLEIPLPESTTQSPLKPPTSKKPKKKKKKKKKQQPNHRYPTSTSSTDSTTISSASTPISVTPALLTTTEAPWATTPAQWRLVAERLFGSPWSDRLQQVVAPSNLAKVRYAAPEKARGTIIKSPNQHRMLRIDEKQRESLKALNNERQALMLQTAREYSQPRRLHYGKINTHEKGTSDSNENESPTNYDGESASRVLDYDLPPKNYHRPSNVDVYDRYVQYNRPRPNDYGMNPMNQQPDYDDDVYRYNEETTNRRPFARTRSFGPVGRKFAGTKTWQDSRYDYSRPWKDKTRGNWGESYGYGSNWPWRKPENDYKIWIPRYRPWSRDEDYPQRVRNDGEDDLDAIEDYDDNEGRSPRNWEKTSQGRTWRGYSEDSEWELENNDEGGSSWTVPERSKGYTRDLVSGSFEKSKNRSELSNKDSGTKAVTKEKPIMPKITMKTWNSLTSDPATWPFKLNGAKPWPKDKNGKTYNPNAELVRKLGLDKQDRLLSSGSDGKGLAKDSTKYKNTDDATKAAKARGEKASIVEKNSMTWPDKLNAVDEWNNDKSRETEGFPQRDEPRPIWESDSESENKMWPGKSSIGRKMESGVGDWMMPVDQSTWKPYEIKHPAYGQLSEGPRSRWTDGTNPVDLSGSSSWSTHQKMNNNWNSESSGYSGDKSAPSTGRSATWPAKWRQFAYHKVTAAPIAKPGSSNPNDASGRSRNSYIAVSAVSAPKYPNNEWRKNDVEETRMDRGTNDQRGKFDRDEPSSQLSKSPTTTKNELWNQRRRNNGNDGRKNTDGNVNDPLEHELEELRDVPYWEHDRLRQQSQKRSDVIGVSTTTVTSIQSSTPPTNSTAIGDEKREAKMEKIQDTDVRSQQKKDITK